MEVDTSVDEDQRSIVYERQDHFSNLNMFRIKEVFCDVIIDSGGKTFQAHKIILAATISYFRESFANDSDEESKTVSIQDVSAQNMEAFLTFAYTGSIVITEENAQTLMVDADYLGLPDVTEQCTKFFRSSLRSDNVSQIYSLAEARGIELLAKECKEFIATHFKDVSKTDEYLYFDVVLLKDILSSREVHADLKLVFDAVVRWITTNLDQRQIYTTELLIHAGLSKLHIQAVIDYFSKDPSLAENNGAFVSEILSLYETFEKIASINENKPMDAEGDSNIEINDPVIEPSSTASSTDENYT